MSISKSEEPIDDGIIREKIYVPPEMMKIVQKYYTTWETMEDIAKTKYYNEVRSTGSSIRSEINDLEKELDRIRELHCELKIYDRHYTNSYFDAIKNIKNEIVEKFPGVPNNKLFSKCDEYVNRVTLQEMKMNLMIPVETANDAEILPKELKQVLVMNKSKLIDAYRLRATSYGVCRRVRYLVFLLELAVIECRSEMEHERVKREKGREMKVLEEKQGEAKRLKKEKFQYLCNVMKEVLGDRVENVVVAFENCTPCSPSCILKDSGMGGKTMEINPHHYIIEDLQKRYDSNNNDVHVRNAALVLFNYAELCCKTMQEHQKTV